MNVSAVNLNTVFQDTKEPWQPVDVARVNDHMARLALLHGEYHWHQHSAEDEMFYVYKGHIVIQFREQPNVTVKQGELAVVPAGTEHRTLATEPAWVLLFEPATTQTAGD
ncbi:cupin domain-containing protein [Candidatus Neomarinimicrobiota bacterium]